MWDPISVFVCMWILNSGLPDARLKVSDVLKSNEKPAINKTLQH
jgi:hypothetical protein